ncbi:hypothetical protein predicted by Glimmer/Critica (plasmid) [Sinorhizobium fredii HH103]|uniref:Uncharacterized protein n=1 Tax=Sinorhizobium fredii (strain HH103) TaxID=1117943 RepID=G9AIV2_SINF1|nr:hypothetical protein predicted by Glimmer/Critica [Sinorhizobium fredii HH103]
MKSDRRGPCISFDFPREVNLPNSVDWLSPFLGPLMAQKLTNGVLAQLRHLDMAEMKRATRRYDGRSRWWIG